MRTLGGESARLIFDQGPDIAMVVAGPQHRVLALNGAGVTALADRPLGRPLRETFPELAGQRVLRLYDEVYETGEPRSGEGWRLALERPEGMVEVILNFLLTPWRHPDGTLGGVIARAVDITETVHARRDPGRRGERGPWEQAEAPDPVTTMQDALLPKHVPVLPAADIAARYLLAAEEGVAGGDWFDAVVRPDGTVALAVGDVVGHGVAASAVMGQLRAVLHDRLAAGEPIDAALTALDRYAERQVESRATTVCVTTLDPGSGGIQYCTAGHPPPVVVSKERHGRFLPPSGAGPLVTGSGWPLAHDRLEAGDLVVLYSDGLVERPGRTPSQSTAEISQVLTDAAHDSALQTGSPQRTAQRVSQLGLELLTRVTGYSDDITVLAAQRTDDFPGFAATLPATADNVRTLRDDLGDWLAPLEISPLDDLTVRHAVSELLTNVVDHAYRDAGRVGDMALEAELESSGELRAVVRDTGRWRDVAATAGRGRGLGMARGLVDDLDVEDGDGGTTATIRHRLTRTAQLLGVDPPAGPQRPGPSDEPFAVDVGYDGAVTVRGPVDAASADRLRATLHRASRGGTRRLSVDLASVTHLGSAGVQVLHEFNQLYGAELPLHAPSGSIAQHVLALVRLPYTERSPSD